MRQWRVSGVNKWGVPHTCQAFAKDKPSVIFRKIQNKVTNIPLDIYYND